MIHGNCSQCMQLSRIVKKKPDIKPGNSHIVGCLPLSQRSHPQCNPFQRSQIQTPRSTSSALFGQVLKFFLPLSRNSDYHLTKLGTFVLSMQHTPTKFIQRFLGNFYKSEHFFFQITLRIFISGNKKSEIKNIVKTLDAMSIRESIKEIKFERSDNLKKCNAALIMFSNGPPLSVNYPKFSKVPFSQTQGLWAVCLACIVLGYRNLDRHTAVHPKIQKSEVAIRYPRPCLQGADSGCSRLVLEWRLRHDEHNDDDVCVKMGRWLKKGDRQRLNAGSTNRNSWRAQEVYFLLWTSVSWWWW